LYQSPLIYKIIPQRTPRVYPENPWRATSGLAHREPAASGSKRGLKRFQQQWSCD